MKKWSLTIIVLLISISRIFAQAPSITSINPMAGTAGTLVTINGANLSALVTLTIGGQGAVVISNTGSVIVAMVMPGVITGPVAITTDQGTATGGTFTFTPPSPSSSRQSSKLIGSGNIGQAGQGYSTSLSADGNTAIIGAPYDNSNQGAVWVYTRSGNNWTQQGAKLVGSGNIGAAAQGWSVAVSADGNTAIVGGDGDNNGQGAAWVFARSGNTWTQQGAKLVGSGSIGAAGQGAEVALSADGNTAIIGAALDNNNQGAAWIFTRTGSTWTQQGAKLVVTGNIGPAVLRAVAISADGNTAIVGGAGDNNSQGAAWIFTRAGSNWTQQGTKLVGSGNVGTAGQGNGVAISADGNTAIVGGPGDNSQLGATWVYTRSGNTWTQQGAKLVGSGGTGAANEGNSVALSADGNTAIVGGFADNNFQGAAWIFTRTGTTWTQVGAKLAGLGSIGQPELGSSVGLCADGSMAIAGGFVDNNEQGAAWVYSQIIPPVLSYSSPQKYDVGQPVTPLSPNSSGVNAQGYNSTLATVGSGFNFLGGVAVDPAGNIYVADASNGAIKEVLSTGGAPITLSTGVFDPYGIAVDAAGNVYVANNNGNSVVELHAGGGLTTLGSGFLNPTAVALDALGNVYVADYGHNAIMKIPPGGGQVVAVGSGFVNPAGVAVDAAGNIYVADYGNDAVKMIPAGGGSIATIVSNVAHPYGIAVDASGNLFFASQQLNTLLELPAGSSSTVVVGSGFNSPAGVAVSGSGIIYVADQLNSTIRYITPAGGYYVNPFLPAGITLNNSTGVLSGTPTGISPAANYTVTAYNNYGSSTATINIAVILTPPVISYATPQNYMAGVSIPTLIPQNTGGPVADFSKPDTLATGFNRPQGIAVDGNGNVYIADQLNNTVVKVPYDGSAVVRIGGFVNPTGVAVDGAGNLYIADTGNSVIEEVPAGTTTPQVIGGVNSNTSYGLAADAAGNVYFSSESDNTVKKITPGSGTPQIIASGFNTPYGLAVDFAGNVYVADYNNNLVKKIPAGGGSPIIIGYGFVKPVAIALDPLQNIYVADSGNKMIKKIPAGGNDPVVVTADTLSAGGIAFDQSGALFATSSTTNLVKKFQWGGYSINTALPEGLTFNTVNGYISGATDQIQAPFNYTVTAYNFSGSGSAIINIAVSPNANLSALKVSSGTITPAFMPSITSYNDNVSNGTNSIAITPAVFDVNATIKVNGVAVLSGQPSGAIGLNVGPNVISIIVTAQGGVITKTYTVTVTRAGSSDAYLSNLTVKTATLSPAFAFKTLAYTSTVPNTTTSVTVTPALLDATATSITVNGTAVANKTASGAIALNVGSNTITVLVTAQDGKTTETYTVSITRAASTNASLAGLKLNSGSLTPAFATGTISYTSSVSNGTTSITVTPTTADPTATVTVNGTATASGTVSAAIALNVGSNTITIIVTAQDGLTTKTYTVTVTRAPSTNAALAGLKVNTATLSPTFSTKTLTYTSSVANATSSVTVTPTLTDATAAVTVNGTAVANKTASGAIALNVGSNTITILVTAQDGKTTEIYTVTVTRAASTNASLAGLKLSSGSLTPAFATGTTSYTSSVGNGITSITVTPTTADPTATVTVNGTATTSGTTSAAIALNVGSNTITTIVTAQDGVTTKTYTVTVTRAASANAALAGLKVTTATLSPTFSTKTLTYTSSVANTTSSVTVTPTLADATATIKVDGTAVANKTASGSIALAVGSNTITTVVTAQDGVTTETYTITITRAASGADQYNPDISVTKPTETPTLAADGVLVHQAVSPNGDGINDFLQIDNISQYPDNKLSIMNRNGQLIYEAVGYDNSTKVFDGHSNKNGQMQQPGTYFYALEYTVAGVTKHKTGFIVLKY